VDLRAASTAAGAGAIADLGHLIHGLGAAIDRAPDFVLGGDVTETDEQWPLMEFKKSLKYNTVKSDLILIIENGQSDRVPTCRRLGLPRSSPGLEARVGSAP
jgi:hypothetical protein